ncbi:hypothetical protein DLAC_05706 [Tieghemostelium lacteum]|uniref:DNA mismatch repair proteins mutS family domain-containing protein n=1 Tax=Tieghemostelium lacteum TaxID=361077 RepID=A0A151ZGN0_TIELA|nr:hypothetical protein DLAC_05706 [Tieghemostelium lacteum]|eukprot:KYQ93085.1 hypothetical protein DLAC_05706 [Tieghemostelium lacteum]
MLKKNLIYNNNKIKLYESKPIDESNPNFHSLTIPVNSRVKESPPPLEGEEVKVESPPVNVVSSASLKKTASTSAAASASNSTTSDNNGNKSCALFNYDDETAYAVYTSSSGTCTLIKCPNTTMVWSSPQTLSGFSIVSIPHMVFTGNGYPALIGASTNQIIVKYLGVGGHNDLGISMAFPSGTTSIQGIYAYNVIDSDMAQVAIIDQRGKLLTSYFSFESDKVMATSWYDWGNGWQGSPCIGSSDHTLWFIAKNISSSRPKYCYSWCYISDPTNYGRWRNMNLLPVSDFIGSPTICRSSSMDTHHYSGIYLTFFSRTNNNSIAFAPCSSPDGYPSTLFQEQFIGFPLEMDLRFPVLGVNTSPFVTMSNSNLLVSGYKISAKVLESFQVVNPNDTFLFASSVTFPIFQSSNSIGVYRTKCFLFLKTSSGSNLTVDYSTSQTPQDMSKDEELNNNVVKEDRGFITFYKSLDVEDNLIRLFDRKGYYSLHGQDAEYVALIHFKSKKSLRYWSTENPLTPMKKKFKSDGSQDVSMSSQDNSSQSSGLAILTIRAGIEYETVIKELFDEKKKVEIWANKPGKLNQWEVIKKGSPGNLQKFEDILTDNPESSVMMALKMHLDNNTRVYGIAFGDATFKTIGLTQFLDDESLSNLGCFIMQKSIKECLIYDDSKLHPSDYKKTLEKLADANIPVTVVPRSDFSSKNVEQDLTRLLGNITNNLSDLEQEHAIQSVSCLIKHLDLLANEAYFGKFKLERFDLEKFMKLDAATFKGLHIIDSKDIRGQSLYQLLNKCSTPIGSRLLLQWVKQPLVNCDEIEIRLNFVEAFIQDLDLRHSLRSNDLKNIGDLDRLSKKLTGPKATLEDCVNLYNTTQKLPNLLGTLGGYQGNYSEIIQLNFITPLDSIIKDFQQFQAMVEQTIDLDLANESHEYVIRSTFNEDLRGIQAKRTQISDKIEEMRLEIADDIALDESKIKLIYTEKEGYLLRVSRKDEVSIRGKSKYIGCGTLKDGSRFTTVKIKMLNESYIKLTQTYMEKQEGLVKKALMIAASFATLVEDLSALIATLDVYTTLAHVSSIAPIPYVRPIIHPMGSSDGTVIKAGRHPCVEQQESVAYIPNDIALLRENSQFHIITGPNMGGKSTFIRQTGLIIILAQIGCFVPCEQAEITIVDCILSRVGAGDSQLRGVSTFMAEMLETSYILKVATKNSLIIIDELGRGTSTYDGFGLAWGIAEYICHQIGAYCLFATHFHELTVLSDLIPIVNNLHVAADTSVNNTLTLLYKVKQGSCDQSFGIHVAILADFPDEVIQTARQKAKELESFESDSLKKNNNQFLEEFKLLDLENCSEEKALSLVNNLLNKYSLLDN